MHTETLPQLTDTLIKSFADQAFLQPFYLSGGTALALEIGHRESEDLDFFNSKDFDPLLLQKQLQEFGSLEDVEIADGTLNCFLNGVKLQFLKYPYPLLEKPIAWDGISISSIIDIACTKLMTVSMRGSKKDFIDVYFLTQQFTLDELIAKLHQKYAGTQYNLPHILKSLVYFANAEQQPMPRMHAQVSWEEVKKSLIEQVKNIKLVSEHS